MSYLLPNKPFQKYHFFKTTLTNPFTLIFISSLITFTQSACGFNSNCDVKCLDKNCDYDPSTNSYYNSSLLSGALVGYQGQGCCTGCSFPYAYDHYYDSSTKSCLRGSCSKDGNGVQQYWYKTNTCTYDCMNDSILYMNPFTGTCERECTNNYMRYAGNKSCVSQCPLAYYVYSWSATDKECKYDCNPYYSNNNTKACQGVCTTGYGDSTAYECVSSCPMGKYRDTYNKICRTLQQCHDRGWYANDISGDCENYCSNSLYADETTKMCVSTCSQGYFKWVTNTTTNYELVIYGECINKTRCNKQSPNGYINNSTLKCEVNCSNSQWGDKVSGYCVVSCPAGKYKYESERVCVSDCSVINSSLVVDASTNSCQFPSYSYYTGGGGGSTTTNVNITISLAAAIIIGVVLVVVVGAIIACNVYMIRKLQMRKRYTDLPLNLSNITSTQINVQYDQR